MTIEFKDILQKDFETFMFSFYNQHKRFDLTDFSNFSCTILNYYVNNNIISVDQKKEAAYYLCTLYNKGIGNRIIEEHLHAISQTIYSDNSVDFTVIQRLFS